MERRKRRSFTPEFRAEAVRLVREGSKSLPQVANDIDLTESALRNWVREADGGKGNGLPDDVPLLDPPVVEVGRAKDRPLWDRWYYLVALVGLLGTEWFLRRRFGYV